MSSLVDQLFAAANGLVPLSESKLMSDAGREIERLESALKEVRDRNVRLLSRLQEYEAREQ